MMDVSGMGGVLGDDWETRRGRRRSSMGGIDFNDLSDGVSFCFIFLLSTSTFIFLKKNQTVKRLTYFYFICISLRALDKLYMYT